MIWLPSPEIFVILISLLCLKLTDEKASNGKADGYTDIKLAQMRCEHASFVLLNRVRRERKYFSRFIS